MSKEAAPEKTGNLAFENIVNRIRRRIVVFSGKGGVGKTTVAVNLAYALVKRGRRVGLLDADITGPNVIQMTGVTGAVRGTEDRILPQEHYGLKLVSLASMLPAGVAVIWRGPMRSKVIEQFLETTAWGDLDALVVDLPPGTGDEILTVVQRIAPQVAVVVTTPQEVSWIDARRAVSFAKELGIGRIGIVENMSGFVCPHCGERIHLFGDGKGEEESRRLGVEWFGAVPLDPDAPAAGDAGRPLVLSRPDSAVAEALVRVATLAAGEPGE
ncbi:MAG: Mrp/NBP35 family ATP-binding protein [Candidatus Bipolaricaulis sp.]|nr:Mrp/NBP35 family ATP-binding protein [Candidatus Bipolaricaulis sp.]